MAIASITIVSIPTSHVKTAASGSLQSRLIWSPSASGHVSDLDTAYHWAPLWRNNVGPLPHETRSAVPSAATITLHCSRDTVSFGLCICQRVSTSSSPLRRVCGSASTRTSCMCMCTLCCGVRSRSACGACGATVRGTNGTPEADTHSGAYRGQAALRLRHVQYGRPGTYVSAQLSAVCESTRPE